MKKILKHFFILIIVITISAGATYAYFYSQAKVKGVTFSTGTASIKIKDENQNEWTEELNGPFFQEIYPGWNKNYTLIVKNTGSTNLNLNMLGNFNEDDDPCSLRFNILVDNNAGENKSLEELKNNQIDLGRLDKNMEKEITLTFLMSEDISLSGEEQCTLENYNFQITGIASPEIQ